jgi:hypothetical protein
MKQLLRLFDTVAFIDPVDDELWRGKLFQDIVREHGAFAAYKDVSSFMPWLRRQEIVKIHDPSSLKCIDDDLTVAATLSDLSDSDWVKSANPKYYGLPTQFDQGGRPVWNIFRPKIPTKVIEALTTNERLDEHLLHSGGDNYAWVLSYAAGSAVGINTHLAAAEELQLAPITDSPLHHELMLKKLARAASNAASTHSLEAYANQVSQRAIIKIFNSILPKSHIDNLSLEDVLKFRQQSSCLRDQFVMDIQGRILAKLEMKSEFEHIKVEQAVADDVVASLKSYSDEIASIRDRLWPKLIDGLTSQTAVATSAAGLAASYISGSGYVLAASVVLQALHPLKVALEWRADEKKASRSAPTAIAYLSAMKELGGG